MRSYPVATGAPQGITQIQWIVINIDAHFLRAGYGYDALHLFQPKLSSIQDVLGKSRITGVPVDLEAILAALFPLKSIVYIIQRLLVTGADFTVILRDFIPSRVNW